jgi:integrase
MGMLKAGEIATLAIKKHHDGEGLYLDKKKRGASWFYKFTLNGKSREMGLGSYPDITLSVARAEAARARALKARGIDPVDERTAVRRRGTTFEEAAREYWGVHCQHYANPNNWIRGMEINVFPYIGKKPVAALSQEDLIKFLRPIWGQEKTRKLRQWINAVIGYVAFDDPRVERDLVKLVDNKLGPQNIEYDNLAAIPWGDIPELWQALPPTLVGLSMKLLILSGHRLKPVVLADWREFDFTEKVWTIPAGRVKRWKYRYRVPLTQPMIDLLRDAGRKWGRDGLVFPSEDSTSGHLSNNAHRLWLHKHNWKDEHGKLATAHGLRSALRTWMNDCKPPVDWRLAEHTIQHMGSLGSQTEQAYLRGDQLEQRREVLDSWSNYVLSGEKISREREKSRERLKSIADKDGRTLEEIFEWSRTDWRDDHKIGMTPDEAAIWARDDDIE